MHEMSPKEPDIYASPITTSNRTSAAATSMSSTAIPINRSRTASPRLCHGRHTRPLAELWGVAQSSNSKAETLREGTDVAIMACGQMVSEACAACDELAASGVKAKVINVHTPKPLDTETIVKAARQTGAVVTAEEHTVMGGFGSAIAEVVIQDCPVPMKMVGVKDRFGVSGEPDELFKYFGLTAADIVKAAKEALAMKK